MERDRPKGIDRLTDRDIPMERDRPKGTRDRLTETFPWRETDLRHRQTYAQRHSYAERQT